MAKSIRDLSEEELYAELDVAESAAEPKVRRAFLAALAAAITATDKKRLIVSFLYGDPTLGLDAVPWAKLTVDFEAMFPDPLLDDGGELGSLINRATRIGEELLPEGAKVIATEAELIAETRSILAAHGKNAASALTDATRAGLKELIEGSFRAGRTIEEVASDVEAVLYQGGGFGLTEQQAAALAKRVNRTADELGLNKKERERLLRTESRAALAKRARLVAETEITNASSIATSRAWEKAGVKLDGQVQEWVTRGDDVVCDNCLDFDEQTAPIGGVFVSKSGTQRAKREPLHPRCVVGETPVRPIGSVEAVAERHYDGPLVVIVTASGKRLVCTPNHPVLGIAGLKAAEFFDVGEYVLCHREIECDPFGLGGDMGNEKAPSMIQDVARSFAGDPSVSPERVEVAAPDFHGDGAGSEVAVVWSDLKLWDGAASERREELRERKLVGARVGAILRDRLGVFVSLLLAVLLAAHRIMSRRGKFRAFGGGHRLHPDSVLFASGPECHAGGTENAVDAMAFVRMASDGQDGLASEITLDRIAGLSRIENWSGHVFTLQTSSGLFCCNGIITQNCRCRRRLIPAQRAA